jgi:hypothetical protein
MMLFTEHGIMHALIRQGSMKSSDLPRGAHDVGRHVDGITLTLMVECRWQSMEIPGLSWQQTPCVLRHLAQVTDIRIHRGSFSRCNQIRISTQKCYYASDGAAYSVVKLKCTEGTFPYRPVYVCLSVHSASMVAVTGSRPSAISGHVCIWGNELHS